MPQTPAHKKPPKPLFANKQWQQCYDSWLRSIYEHSGSETSEQSYRTMTVSFFVDPRRSPDGYTRPDVEEFVRRPVSHHGEKHPASVPTQNHRLSILRSFYTYASQYDVPFRQSVRPILHTPNPTRGMKTIKPGRKRRDLSEDELKQLFAAIPRDSLKAKRDFALFSFYFWTARRLSEIVRLTWGDIFEVVFIVNDQPRRGHMYRFVTKGHSREIFTAELPPPAWDALKEYLVAKGCFDTMEPGAPLFTRLDYARRPWEPEKPLNMDSIDRILAKYVKLAGLELTDNRKICVHSFRHTRARAQYRREHDVMEIKRLLGHTNISSTQIYLIDAEDKPDSGAALLAAELGRF